MVSLVTKSVSLRSSVIIHKSVKGCAFFFSCHQFASHAIRCRRLSWTLSRVSFFPVVTLLTNVLPDLIRHGKNHHQTAKQHHHAPQDTHQPQQLQQVTVQPVSKRHHDPTLPLYAKEAELIVQEEREAKSKLPLHKGLERFQLIDKMGESVPHFPLLITSQSHLC